ncbi:MAG: electron transfer flavoprotein subunit alpha/FixB family protein [bacterium]
MEGYEGVWTVAEADEGKIKQVSYELLTRGRRLADKLNSELTSILISDNITKEQAKELIYRGADRVYLINAPELDDFIVENYSNILVDMIEKYKPSIVLAAATSRGRTLMPHVAVRIKAGLTADCTDLDIEENTGNLLQIRPAIGGNILATIKTPEHRPQMATVRPRSTRPLSLDRSRKGEIYCPEINKELIEGKVKKIDFRTRKEEDINLEEADIIVAGGKGLKKAENFKLVRKMADTLGGAVGASREAVDRDWISYPHQIGLSGKTVTPKLYIAIGISGAIQHLAGMKTADRIIAINEDPEANIFKVADIGLIGDLFEIVPELTKQLAEVVNNAKI